MYGARCQTMGALTFRFWQLLINMFVEDRLAQEVNLSVEDSFYMVIKRVTDTFRNKYLLFMRKVKFINLKAEPGKQAANRARRLDKLAELQNIKAQELTLMNSVP